LADEQCGLCLKVEPKVCVECYLKEMEMLRADVALLSKKVEEMQLVILRLGLNRIAATS